MIPLFLAKFSEVILFDFEYISTPGNNPVVVCLVYQSLKSGQVKRIWSDELNSLEGPPYPTDASTLFISYNAVAEISCHLALNWPVPKSILDLYAEFRREQNGQPLKASGSAMLKALAYYRLPGITEAEKEANRNLILSGGPWSDQQKIEILDYCQSDVTSLGLLLGKMAAEIDIDRALIRGDFMASIAKIEHQGIPIDFSSYSRLTQNWELIKLKLIEEVNSIFHVYEGTSFRQKLFAEWLRNKKICWPMGDNGRIRLDEETFKQQILLHPELEPLHQVRSTVSKLRELDLSIGLDHRNRSSLMPFWTKTGRNQPSPTKFIFGAPSWLRHLIKAPEGKSLAYIDYEQQEFAIAAALSKDKKMMEDYLSGDPYLALAKRAGAVPPQATKESHRAERDKYKQCVLAIQYCMGFKSLAERLGIAPFDAQKMLAEHREIYSTFWNWSDSMVAHSRLNGVISTVFGWRFLTYLDPKEGTLRAFPMQANGAEILRIACIGLHERGIPICATIHDAILIETPAETAAATMQTALSVMVDASKAVLEGFPLRTEVKLIGPGEHFKEDKGLLMWTRIQAILDGLGA